MISVQLILFIMLCHWVADFICQSDEMAKGKSTSNYWLSLHVAVYTSIMAATATMVWGMVPMVLLWVVVNGSLHWVTDYVTSRGSSYFFKMAPPDYHNGFVVVGFDQWIHLVCLTLTTVLMF